MSSRNLISAILVLLATAATAHVGLHPSVHDTVAGIIDRMRTDLPAETLTTLTVPKVLEFLTPEERTILGSEHITFNVNVPVVVSVIKDARLKDEPFWLPEREFTKTGLTVLIEEDAFEVWQKAFPAGPVGLGVNSVSGSGDHYFVCIAPQQAGATVELADIYPGQHTTGVFRTGERVYVGWDDSVAKEVPAELEGQLLLRGDMDGRRDAKMTDIFRLTMFPATATPDQIVLTWSADPKTTQSIQWRTSTAVEKGALRYQQKPDSGQADEAAWKVVQATMDPLENISTVNDPVVNRFTVALEGLTPGASYFYAVGDGSEAGWSATAEFNTAPDKVVPFKFVYMGDAQNGLEAWGKLVNEARVKQPEAAFYIMAGDLVNRGNERDDWDLFFTGAKGVFENRQLVPCIGNHECQGTQGPWMYLELFDLPENGPAGVDKERAYAYEYSNALFVVLDSNLEPASQTEWMEQQLANSKANWKFVVYHHPLYSSGPRRDNPELRQLWGGLFDKYHVDLALQGHDHAYLRTWPMKDGGRVASPAEGTIYIISVSGTKFYDQAEHDYTEFGMTNVATYQVLDIQIEDNKLTYKAYDIDGKVRDEFVIEK